MSRKGILPSKKKLVWPFIMKVWPSTIVWLRIAQAPKVLLVNLLVMAIALPFLGCCFPFRLHMIAHVILFMLFKIKMKVFQPYFRSVQTHALLKIDISLAVLSITSDVFSLDEEDDHADVEVEKNVVTHAKKKFERYSHWSCFLSFSGQVILQPYSPYSTPDTKPRHEFQGCLRVKTTARTINHLCHNKAMGTTSYPWYGWQSLL